MVGGLEVSDSVNKLHDAVTEGNLSRVVAILSSSKLDVDECDGDGLTALQQACFRGNIEIAKLLVNHGANVNWSKHKQGYTALMFAAIAGNLNLISFLLLCGASVSATNCLKRTASEMAGFVGNYFAVALINTYVGKDAILEVANLRENFQQKMSAVLIEPLHKLVIGLNFSPVKVFQFLSLPLGSPLLDQWKISIRLLEDLLNKYFTPHNTHEPLALKFHLLACCLKRAGEFRDAVEESQKSCDAFQKPKKESLYLESLIKQFLRGTDPHGLPLGQERFLRQAIASFPRMESNLWQQIVQQVSSVEPGRSPTALSVLENSINGLSPFSRSSTGRGIDTEPCATCADMPGGGSEVVVKRCSQCHEVAYCSVACQRLHWFTHKKYCLILKEHHDSVAEKNAGLSVEKNIAGSEALKVSKSGDDAYDVASEIRQHLE